MYIYIKYGKIYIYSKKEGDSLDYYKILGVKDTATDKEIKDAYRKLAKKYHPDTFEGDKKFAENKMKEINEAYDFLSKPENRETINYEEKNADEYNDSQAYTPHNSYESNYEEGTVYDFDDHFKTHTTRANPYYNYSPYEDENDYTKMYYVDFGQIKSNLIVALKHFLIKSVLTFITFIILVVVTFNFAIKSINDIFGGTEELRTPINDVPATTYDGGTSVSYPEDQYYKEEFEKQVKELDETFSKYAEEHKEDFDELGKKLEEYWSKLKSINISGETNEDY